MVVLGQACRERPREVRSSYILRRDAEPPQAKSLIPCCQEKPLASSHGARTPNQHRWASREYSGDRENDGQGTRQIASVTSGEGGPQQGDALRVLSLRGWHKPGGSDCLLKTQQRAKPQGAVYAVTPARCRKVTGKGQPSGEALNLSPGKRRPQLQRSQGSEIPCRPWRF
eukprot:TRINITY_DN3172_c1_g1_i1.p2 TRINITY_DN3172_c1_g1~~TRINITY_DN3172_c1_g1_i1.p2  ORF type:complete len:170 (-),score=5.96 TRINITY_DN3172_c1_g1_i1:26-535(-)